MEKHITKWQIDTDSAMKYKHNDVARLPQCSANLSSPSRPHTEHFSFFPLPLSSSSPSLSAYALPSVCLVLCFALQESVVQQLDSSGRRQPGCAGGPPLSPSGTQLHQPHHRGSLQRPQGRTHSVSTDPPPP